MGWDTLNNSLEVEEHYNSPILIPSVVDPPKSPEIQLLGKEAKGVRFYIPCLGGSECETPPDFLKVMPFAHMNQEEFEKGIASPDMEKISLKGSPNLDGGGAR
jgi:hypothetical protein